MLIPNNVKCGLTIEIIVKCLCLKFQDGIAIRCLLLKCIILEVIKIRLNRFFYTTYI